MSRRRCPTAERLRNGAHAIAAGDRLPGWDGRPSPLTGPAMRLNDIVASAFDGAFTKLNGATARLRRNAIFIRFAHSAPWPPSYLRRRLLSLRSSHTSA